MFVSTNVFKIQYEKYMKENLIHQNINKSF
jgi:hypothetical protein